VTVGQDNVPERLQCKPVLVVDDVGCRVDRVHVIRHVDYELACLPVVAWASEASMCEQWAYNAVWGIVIYTSGLRSDCKDDAAI